MDRQHAHGGPLPHSPGLEVGDEGAGTASRSCFIAHLELSTRPLGTTSAAVTPRSGTLHTETENGDNCWRLYRD